MNSPEAAADELGESNFVEIRPKPAVEDIAGLAAFAALFMSRNQPWLVALNEPGGRHPCL